MIHTIISLDDVFADANIAKTETRKIKCGYAEYITFNGRSQLRRLISTNPADYLKSEYQPFRFYS